MKPQIIDRFVYVKGKKISEVENTGTLHGEELIPIADNNQNFHTTVDLISEYVDNSHDYLTTGDYNDLKGQIDSERTNRQEADNELNQSIQDTKSELHSTISNVESELLNEVNDLQGLIDNINDTGIANGVTLDTAQTITGEKTFTTVPKSTADATEDTDLVNKKYVDDAVANVDVDLDGYATQVWVNEQGFARTSDIPEGLEIGETTGTAFDGGRGKAVEDKVGNLPQYVVTSDRSNPRFVFNKLGNGGLNFNYAYADLSTGDLFSDEISIPTATVNNAGLMSTADKKKLDSLSDSSDVYVIDYITEDSGTVTLELYNELRAAIESNKMIVFLDGNDNVLVGLCSLDNNSITILVSQNIPRTPELRITVTGSVCVIKSDYTYSISGNSALLIANGDGTKFLGDDGEYHTVNTSEIVADVEGKYDKTGGPINGDVAITGNLTVNGDEVLTNSNYESVIGDVLLTSEADDKYLPLSGGTLNGDLIIRRNTPIIRLEDSSTASSYAFMYPSGASAVLSNTNSDVLIGCELRVRDGGLDRFDKKTREFYTIYDSGNLDTDSFTRTDISGGLGITSITQSAYDELPDKDANTLYIITE